MSLPKRLSGIKYTSASEFNSYVSFLNPNAGQQADGTPNAPTTVVSGIHAKIAQWRSKEQKESQTRVAASSYKVVIHYPKTYTIDSGMQIQVANGPLLQIEGLLDPDGQRVEMHIWAWAEDATS